MLSLYLKEIGSYFNSSMGYLVMIVFQLVTGLFLWVFPGEMNILAGGYAALDSLFFIAPWIFLFLIPAITMRTFADEKKSGALELLLTRPLSEIQIIAAKYFSSLTLVFISLLPSLIYVWSICRLGSPMGNIDAGATIGSYIGLFFLSSFYVAAGLFCSTLSENSITAFIIALVVCFLLSMGIDLAAPLLGSLESVVLKLGVNEHYKSLSRGVVELQDVAYFSCGSLVFILLAKASLQSGKWK